MSVVQHTIAGVLKELPCLILNKAVASAWIRLEVKPDTQSIGKSAARIQAELQEGDPEIWVNRIQDTLMLASLGQSMYSDPPPVG